jgi:hypothetical protein
MATLDELTTLGIISLKALGYPQGKAFTESYPVFRYTSVAGLPTPIHVIQVLDKRGENADIHRKVRPLSTTTTLN